MKRMKNIPLIRAKNVKGVSLITNIRMWKCIWRRERKRERERDEEEEAGKRRRCCGQLRKWRGRKCEDADGWGRSTLLLLECASEASIDPWSGSAMLWLLFDQRVYKKWLAWEKKAGHFRQWQVHSKKPLLLTWNSHPCVHPLVIRIPSSFYFLPTHKTIGRRHLLVKRERERNFHVSLWWKTHVAEGRSIQSLVATTDGSFSLSLALSFIPIASCICCIILLFSSSLSLTSSGPLCLLCFACTICPQSKLILSYIYKLYFQFVEQVKPSRDLTSC